MTMDGFSRSHMQGGERRPTCKWRPSSLGLSVKFNTFFNLNHPQSYLRIQSISGKHIAYLEEPLQNCIWDGGRTRKEHFRRCHPLLRQMSSGRRKVHCRTMFTWWVLVLQDTLLSAEYLVSCTDLLCRLLLDWQWLVWYLWWKDEWVVVPYCIHQT